ncbi:DUF547 domain-containing protein [Winogradskyella psychrotolerans]|uniref:DUF547 domain-containing protein n=1 Tax=Winogradskyella psychrotolerans TaxID=1344585 RepID=UPI001C06C0AE|nr:DUF547 domain-containing protein [Winogradskyella psychrotolerans]MBU2927727.1 DUF547 domain-containing protein [Winogradskyella psychrotolerans]
MTYLSVLIITLIFTLPCCGLQQVTQNPIHKTEVADSLEFRQHLTKKEGDLHTLFDELLQKYVSKNGNVDYVGFKMSHGQLLGYISILSQLYPRLDEISREEKLAYWINAYNALTIDLILRNYPTKSIKDIKDPWDQRLWKFGDNWQNLNDIEHKILRHMDEPRIHFAIVCASISCPKLQNEAFTASNLDAQLTKATKEFLADSTKNKLSKDDIKISKIFKWFKKDFEQNGSLIDFLNQYSDVTISDSAKKSYTDYNWGLND